MRRLGTVLLVVLLFVLPACSKRNSESTNTPAPSTESPSQTAPTPEQTTPPMRLVDKLPAGVEGVELTDRGLRVLEGYKYVDEKDGTFSIARLRDGSKTGTGGSCGCRGAGKCDDGDQGGIIVCVKDSTCGDCGLRITAGGVTTALFMY